MSEAVAEYLILTRQVLEARKRSLGPIENTLLSKLDAAWEAMSDEEQSQADAAVKKLIF